MRPSSLVESDEWTALRKFRLDEAVLVAGTHAERRAQEEARAEAEAQKDLGEGIRGQTVAFGEGSTRDQNGPASPGRLQPPKAPELSLDTGKLTSGTVPFIGRD